VDLGQHLKLFTDKVELEVELSVCGIGGKKQGSRKEQMMHNAIIPVNLRAHRLCVELSQTLRFW
jgi:hypothetical protein